MLQDRSNERYLRFDKATFSDLMENTRCTCGCGKMALSQCPLDCPWNPRVQRFWKVALALGMSRDEARDYYPTRANKVHRGEDDPMISLDSIILNQEKSLSWGVPVAMGLAALATVLGGLAVRMQPRAVPVATSADASTAAPAVVEAADRELCKTNWTILGL